MQPRGAAGLCGRAGRLTQSVTHRSDTPTTAFSLLQKTQNKPQKPFRLLFSCAGRIKKSRTFEKPFYSGTPQKVLGLLFYSPVHLGVRGKERALSAARSLFPPVTSRRVESGLSAGYFLLLFYSAVMG